MVRTHTRTYGPTEIRKYASTQIRSQPGRKYADTQVCRYAGSHANTQTRKDTNTQTHKHVSKQAGRQASSKQQAASSRQYINYFFSRHTTSRYDFYKLIRFNPSVSIYLGMILRLKYNNMLLTN